MQNYRKELHGIAGAFSLLAVVSLYRQISLHCFSADHARPYVVYAVYLAVLFWWGASINKRITQKSIRGFLLAEDAVMFFWLSIRFVQDAFLLEKLYLMRLFGYFIFIPAVTLPLLGLYAAFGLGRGDGYRMPNQWYFLAIPAAVLIAGALTNEYHHLIYYVIESEPQPNLYFHPYIGIYLIYLWVLGFVLARVYVIYKRNRLTAKKSALRKAAPLFEIVLLAVFCAPYTASSFIVDMELMEFSAGVFFIEALSWEVFIAMGLIPVNTQYEQVFDRSTVAMQIVSENGTPLMRSRRAPMLSENEFASLRRGEAVATPDGRELQLYGIAGGYLIWEKDVSQLRSVVRKLRKTAGELEQEGALLSRELQLKSEEAAVSEQNRIYNTLTEEVGGQLSLLKSLLLKKDTAEDKAVLFRQICLVGTYVKRRCNLRLIEQSAAEITREDIDLSFRDLLSCLADMSVPGEIEWRGSPAPSPGFALKAFDLLEYLLEFERFEPDSVHIIFGADPAFRVAVSSANARRGSMPAPETGPAHDGRYPVVCEAAQGGYVVTMLEEGGVSA